MNHVLMTIKPYELAGVAEAARLFYKEKNKVCRTFILEEKIAKRLRDNIWNVEWSEDATLFIDELPFKDI